MAVDGLIGFLADIETQIRNGAAAKAAAEPARAKNSRICERCGDVVPVGDIAGWCRDRRCPSQVQP